MIPLFDKACSNMTDIEGCPSNLVPLYGTTVPDFTLVMPALGLSTDVNICTSNQVLVGMWIYFVNFGTFLVTAVSSSGKRITIKNGCANGAAVAGNVAPNTSTTGQLIFYVVSPPDCDLGFDAAVKDAYSRQSALNLWCITNPPQLTDNEEGYIAVLSAACDPGDCPAGPDPNCSKVNKFIKVAKNSIIIPEGWRTIDPSLDADQCKLLGPLVSTKDGEVVRPLGALTQFHKPILIAEQAVEHAANFSQLTFPINVGGYVPQCAKLIKLRGWLALDGGPDDDVRANLYVTGPGISTTDPNYKLTFIDTTSDNDVEFNFTWYNEIPVTEASKVLTHNFQIIYMGGGGDFSFSYGVYLMGYYL